MKIIPGKPVSILFPSSDDKSSVMRLIRRFVIGKADITVKSVNAAFDFQPSKYRLKFYYFIYYLLDKRVEVLPGFQIHRTVFNKPIPVVVAFNGSKKIER